MFNKAAYSYTHHLLWSHLHFFKPQSLQVGSTVEMSKVLIPTTRSHSLFRLGAQIRCLIEGAYYGT